jgi:hypothetical protein
MTCVGETSAQLNRPQSNCLKKRGSKHDLLGLPPSVTSTPIARRSRRKPTTSALRCYRSLECFTRVHAIGTNCRN